MTDKVWKAFERRVSKFFKTTRTPLSGGNSKQTRSDTLHPKLYIEMKYRKKSTIWTLYEDTRTKAKSEGKLPIVVIGSKNKKGFLIVIHANDLQDFFDVLKSEGIIE